MPLKGKQLVVYPCKTLWRGLNFAPNHNPSMEKWWVTHLQALWIWKEANLIILLWWIRKLGQMKRVRMKEKPMLRLPFLHGKSPTSPTTSCRSKLHDWIKIDSRCFDDNKDDDKKPKRMISRLSQEQFKNQEKFDFSFKFQETRIIKIKIQDSRFKNQEKTQSR